MLLPALLRGAKGDGGGARQRGRPGPDGDREWTRAGQGGDQRTDQPTRPERQQHAGGEPGSEETRATHGRVQQPETLGGRGQHRTEQPAGGESERDREGECRPGQQGAGRQTRHACALRHCRLRLEHHVGEHRADHQGRDDGDVGVVEGLPQRLGGPAAAPVLDQQLEVADPGRRQRRGLVIDASPATPLMPDCSSASSAQFDDPGGHRLDQRRFVTGEDDRQTCGPFRLQPRRPAS